MSTPFTLDEDAYICAAYSVCTFADIAAALGRPRAGSIQQRVTRLIRDGHLSLQQRATRRPWTEADEDYLAAHWGHHADAKVAKKLGRTVVSCQVRAKRIGVCRKRNVYPAREIAHIFGVDDTTIAGWITRGWLAGKRSLVRCGRTACWHVPDEAVETFIRTHPDKYDAGRITHLYWRNQAKRALAAAPGPVLTLTRRQRALWTSTEDGYLAAQWGILPDADIAQHLHRTPGGCKARAEDLGLTRRAAICSASAVARQLGVPLSRVMGWIKSGALPAEKSSIRTGAGRRLWHITPWALARFCQQYAARAA